MMARTIWKFPVPLDSQPVIEMPAGAQPLTVQTQVVYAHDLDIVGHRLPMLWAIVDSVQELVPYRFRIIGTGDSVPDTIGEYVGTWQQKESFFHLFTEL